MRRTVMAFLVLAMALRAYCQESPEEAATAAVLIAKDSLLIEKDLPKALSSPHTSFKDNMREEQDAKLLDSCGLGAQSGVAPGCNLSSGDEHLEGGTAALGAGAGLPADYASVFIDDAAHDPQAESAAFGVLGGEKYVEKPSVVLLWNPRAIVDHQQSHARLSQDGITRLGYPDGDACARFGMLEGIGNEVGTQLADVG